jgi:glycosyltransferase involved in cell wall biosynthesis
MDTDTISLVLTNHNRTEFLYESFAKVANDERISEIVISDDYSDFHIYEQVCNHYKEVDKVKIFRNPVNVDCYRNKKRAVELASNDWVILFDSDNIINTDYIDAIYEQKGWQNNPDYRSVIFAPEFARPHFDFRALAGKLVDRTTVSGLLNMGNCATMLNAMNYFVNRNEYLRVWDDSGIDPVTSDSIYQNYRWLSFGNSIYVLPGLQYDHRVHSGSHYQNNHRRTAPGLHQDIMNRVTAMK